MTKQMYAVDTEIHIKNSMNCSYAHILVFLCTVKGLTAV